MSLLEKKHIEIESSSIEFMEERERNFRIENDADSRNIDSLMHEAHEHQHPLA